MNTWRNETVEVCAPQRNIVGKNIIYKSEVSLITCINEIQLHVHMLTGN